MTENTASAMPEILVYADEGAGAMSTRSLVNALEHALDPERIRVRRVVARDIVPAHEIEDPPWMRTAVAIAFPGGADRPWVGQLAGRGNHAIRTFVERGGTYLGICAGAYYACRRFTFELDHPDPAWRITAVRELDLFRGTAHGSLRELAMPYLLDVLECTTTVPLHWYDPPLPNPFSSSKDPVKPDDINPDRAKASGHLKIEQANDVQPAAESPALYWGGPCFVPDADSEVDILARYAGLPTERSIAAVRCPVGNGVAVLSGAHIEVSADDYEAEGQLDMYQNELTRAENPQQARYQHNVATLREADAHRLDLFRRLLKAANLGEWLKT
ncbi:MAG: BPL-N domain-containing protein [Planctomycetota bacterium]